MKAYLKPFLILLPLILIIAYYLVSLSNRSEFPEEENQLQNKPQAFENLNIDELIDWKGRKISVAPAVEPIIILHFWASWCGPCIHEFPDLIKMANAMKGRVKVFALSEDNNKEEIDAFIKSFKDAETTENFHIIWDENHKIMNEWQVNKLPESYIFGPGRKLAKHVSGVVSWSLQDTFEYFKALELISKKPSSKNSEQF
jgi:thiol-disulfide isomerase/thioredoxin